MRPVCLIVLSLLVLAACGSHKEKPKGEQTPTRTIATEAPAGDSPSTRSPVYDRLRRDYESLRTSHQAISAVWEALADNQQVQCGTYPEVLNPDSIQADSDAAVSLSRSEAGFWFCSRGDECLNASSADEALIVRVRK